MQYPQPTNEAQAFAPAQPKVDGPSQPHFSRRVLLRSGTNPHAHAPTSHPHPAAHFPEHPHWSSSTPFSRLWGWSSPYAVPPPPPPVAPPSVAPAFHHPYPHPSNHTHFRRTCRPRSRLFFPILLGVAGVVAYKRLQRDIDDVRSEAVDKDGRPLVARKRHDEWRERWGREDYGGWEARRAAREEEERQRIRRDGEEQWAERWRAAMGQPRAQQQHRQEQTATPTMEEKWV